jgi:hypothetical protein
MFTMKIYYHWMPGKKKSEVDELDDMDFRQGADRVQISTPINHNLAQSSIASH